MRVRACAATAFIASWLATSCGGSSNGRTAVEIYATKTRNARTAHISLGYPGAADIAEGDLDISHSKMQWHAVRKQPSGINALVALGSHAYVKLTLGGTIGPWCSATETDSVGQPFGLDPLSALGSLRSPARLQQVGNERVRGVETVHYRIVGGPSDSEAGTPTDLWVDRDDRLRRLVIDLTTTPGTYLGTQKTGTELLAIEFCDYGVNLPPITVPTDVNPRC